MPYTGSSKRRRDRTTTGVFKSYDIRAVYPTELHPELGRKIGVGLGRLYRGFPENAGKRLKIVVGRDMRLSAPEMAGALIDGLVAAGCDVIDVGMVSTPCQYFAIQRLGADGGGIRGSRWPL